VTVAMLPGKSASRNIRPVSWFRNEAVFAFNNLTENVQIQQQQAHQDFIGALLFMIRLTHPTSSSLSYNVGSTKFHIKRNFRDGLHVVSSCKIRFLL
jgi:hypothetical protein